MPAPHGAGITTSPHAPSPHTTAAQPHLKQTNAQDQGQQT
jgi:hypothetical protein